DAPRPVGAGVPRAVAHAGVVRPDGLLALLPLEPGRLLLVELVLQQVVDGLQAGVAAAAAGGLGGGRLVGRAQLDLQLGRPLGERGAHFMLSFRRARARASWILVRCLISFRTSSSS